MLLLPFFSFSKKEKGVFSLLFLRKCSFDVGSWRDTSFMTFVTGNEGTRDM